MENYHRNKTFEKISYANELVEDREFHNCKFVDCNFNGNQFQDCYFENCTFIRCDLSLIKVTDSSFIHVQLHDCKAIGVIWSEASNPFSVSFENCIINYSCFFGKTFRNGKFLKCIAHEVSFAEAKMKKANFQGTDLRGSIFGSTDLSEANFEDAINYEIDLQSNTTKGAIFKFPEAVNLLRGFDIVLK